MESCFRRANMQVENHQGRNNDIQEFYQKRRNKRRGRHVIHEYAKRLSRYEVRLQKPG